MMHPIRRSRLVVSLSFLSLIVVGATAAAQSAPQPVRAQTRPARDTTVSPTVVPPPLPSHVDIPAVPRTRQVAPAVVAPSVAVTPSSRAVVDVPRPAGATARCKDGTYLTSAPSQSECDRNGGLAVRFPTAAQAVRR